MMSAAKYVVVGVVGYLTYFLLLVVCVEYLALSPLLGSSIGFVWVVVQSYFLNKDWTFKSDKKHAQALPRYVIASSICFTFNLTIMYLMINVLGIWYLLAQAIAAVAIPAINFLLNKHWTFS